MCDHSRDPGGKEAAMVEAHPGAWCDPCLAPLVKALNEGGIETVASCCGHGRSTGSVCLADGRVLEIHPGLGSITASPLPQKTGERLRRAAHPQGYAENAILAEQLRDLADRSLAEGKEETCETEDGLDFMVCPKCGDQHGRCRHGMPLVTASAFNRIHGVPEPHPLRDEGENDAS